MMLAFVLVSPHTVRSNLMTTRVPTEGSVRDDYDNPEDFYEDNRDWFDDEDEAWDYWYED